jgi:hypothetical protein
MEKSDRRRFRFIMRREGIIQLVDEALSNLRKAQPNVAPQGQYELGYLINRTEVYRETFAGLNLFRGGMVEYR